MNEKLAITLIWSLSAAILLRLWRAWDRLPEREAVHFSMRLQPNGWAGKSSMLLIVIVFTLGQAILGSWLILTVSHGLSIVNWIQVLVSAMLVSAFWQMISFNADRKPFRAAWVVVPLVMLFASITAFMLDLSFRMYRH